MNSTSGPRGEAARGEMLDQPKPTHRTRSRRNWKNEYDMAKLKRADQGVTGPRIPGIEHSFEEHVSSRDGLPVQLEEDVGKVTLLINLDDVLLSPSTVKTVAPRPGLLELFSACKAHQCEVVVWTAGLRAYAHAVIRNIDTEGVIKHCLCTKKNLLFRHRSNYRGLFEELGFTFWDPQKQRAGLGGRSLDNFLVIDTQVGNLRQNERRAILLVDYEEAEQDVNQRHRTEEMVPATLHSSSATTATSDGTRGDCSLFALAELVRHLPVAAATPAEMQGRGTAVPCNFEVVDVPFFIHRASTQLRPMMSYNRPVQTEMGDFIRVTSIDPKEWRGPPLLLADYFPLELLNCDLAQHTVKFLSMYDSSATN